jgi:hypothetical protein
MFTTAALKGFETHLTVNATGLTREASKELLVKTAVQARNRVLHGTPKPSGYRQVVDGREGAALDAVRPDGTILFAWQYLAEVAEDTLGALENRSPHHSGAYILGLRVYVNGSETELAEINSDTREVRIVATVPYARRLEVGKRKSGGPFVLQVRPHIVEQTAIVARKLYGSLADIRFGYVDLTNAYHLRTSASHRRVRSRTITDVQYPAIIITPRLA